MHIGQGGKTHDQGLERAGQSGQRGRQHESHQLVAVDLIAQRNRARFVFTNHLEYLAKRGMHNARNGQETGHKHSHHQVIHGGVRLERQQAKQRTARHALQAVLTPGKRRLQADKIDHLRQGQGDHGEIDALTPDGHITDHQADQA